MPIKWHNSGLKNGNKAHNHLSLCYRQAMETFISIHDDAMIGSLTTFDRLISRGHLDSLCRSHSRDGKRFARFTPLSETDRNLFAAVMSGEFTLNGFRNSDLAQKLFAKPPASDKEAK